MHQHRLELTRQLVAQLPEIHRISVDEAVVQWWVNLRSSGGLRLTHQGFRALKDHLGLEHWDYSINDPRSVLTKRLILDMDRRIQWPWFIDSKPRRLIFFNSRDAMMITLYDDLRAWLDSLVDKKTVVS